MIMVLPREPGLGEILGSALGGGFASGANQIAEAQLQNILNKQKAEAAAQQPMTPYQQVQTALRARELGQKESKEGSRKEEWEYSQHKDFRNKVVSNYQDTLEADMRLDRMAELNDAGSLTTPATAALLDKFGLPVAILGSPDSEEFDKLSKDLLKNIRTYFGARINVVEVENFLKTIPTLMNSEEGRRRVINNLKLLGEPKKLMFDEYRKIKQESQEQGKALPIDLEEAVLERIKPQLDNLAEIFQTGLPQKLDQQTAPQTREFQKMPSAKDYAGVVIEDDKGKRYKSDGKTWRKL